MAERISVGSVSATVVPDMSRFADEIKAKSRSISPTIGVSADTTEMRAQIDEAAQNRDTTINANADTTEANAQLDRAAHTRTATINAKANGLSSLVGGFNGLTTAVVGLGPALIPATAALGGLALALATPIAAAGGGLTLFGFIAGFAVKQTEEQSKKIQTLAKAVQTAKQSMAASDASTARSSALSLASARASAQASVKAAQQALAQATTPAATKAAQQRLAAAQASLQTRQEQIAASASNSHAAAQAKVTQATAAYKTALAGLTPQQRAFLGAQSKLTAAFRNFEGSAGKAVFGPLTAGLKLLTSLLPAIKPVIVDVSKGIGSLFGNIAKAAKSPEFKAFLKDFGAEATTSILAFGKILGNLALGFAGLINAFGPLAGPMLGGIINLSKQFATFGQDAGKSSGFQNFVAYVKREGPVVVQTVGNLAGAAGRVLHFFAPLGDAVLHAVDGIAGFIRTAKPGEIDGIATAISGLALAFGHTPVGLAFALAAMLDHSGPARTFLKDIGDLAKTFVGWFNKLPDGFKEAALAAVGIGAVGIKLKGVLGGSLFGGGSGSSLSRGGILGLFSKAKPLPVYVTNEGFGGLGKGAGLGGVAAGAEGAAGLSAGAVAGIVAASVAALGVLGYIEVTTGNKHPPSQDPNASHTGVSPILGPQNPGVIAQQNALKALRGETDKTDERSRILNGDLDTMASRIRALPDRKTVNLEAPSIQQRIDALKTFKGYWDGLSNKTIELNIKSHGNKVAHQLGVPGVATGGYVTGPGTGTSDSIPVRLSNGEYVIRAAAVKAIGTDVLDKMNAQGYAAGGQVTAPGAGVNINVGTVQAHNYDDFMAQMHARAIRAGGGGVSMS